MGSARLCMAAATLSRSGKAGHPLRASGGGLLLSPLIRGLPLVGHRGLMWFPGEGLAPWFCPPCAGLPGQRHGTAAAVGGGSQVGGNARGDQGAAVTAGRWTAADVIALSDERERWLRWVDYAWRWGHAAGAASGRCAGHDQAVREAFAAGARAAYESRAAAFDAGWAACLDRFADEIGGRVYPAHPTHVEQAAWARHAPGCSHSGGSGTCEQAGCLPGPRKDFGKPAPWDRSPAQITAAARASWAPVAVGGRS